MTTERSLESVDKVVVHAKLDPADLLPQSQTLYFADELLDQDSVRLMEVDKHLADALEAGQTLVLRGREDDGAVLCTQDKTYDVKEAETSNSLLVLDDLAFSDRADHGLDGHLGLRRQQQHIGASLQ